MASTKTMAAMELLVALDRDRAGPRYRRSERQLRDAVRLGPPGRYRALPVAGSGIVFGYAATDEHRITDAVQRLARIAAPT